ncbi:MAG: sulfite exporter TauE/SafE family protein [Spirochaetaceae bacterium]|jgi:uncharacterized membrane protein|nr:sulfite exporter TauE/SafE family protein [Spirochaetaceae bacterium]
MLEPLLLGLSTGPSCMIFCGPVALPLFMSDMKEHRGQGAALLRFLTGRLIGYILAGFILGLTGQLLLNYLSPLVKDRFMLISYMLVGLMMLLRGLAFLPKEKGLCQKARKVMPQKRAELFLGLATGLNLCPPFLAMATRVTQGPVKGMFSFFLFFIGTSIYLVVLMLLPFLKKHKEALQGIGRITMLMMGGYFFFFLGILQLGRWQG